MTRQAGVAPSVDPDDRESNPSSNERFDSLLARRLHRRHFLKGGVSALTVASLGPLALASCGDDDGGTSTPPPPTAATERTLGFAAVPKDLADQVTVAAGYTATVLYATGDSIDRTSPLAGLTAVHSGRSILVAPTRRATSTDTWSGSARPATTRRR